MKKFFIPMACMLAAIVSCQKNDAADKNPETIQPVMVTLRATIGDDDTKVSYVEEDNVLKTAWELYDKVSLVALDASGKLLSNDVFTAQAAGKSAEFKGTFTNDPSTASVMVYYPALTQGEGTAENPYRSPVENGYSATGVLWNGMIGSQYIRVRGAYYLQKNNADPSHLEQYTTMCGQAVMNGSQFTVNLEHMSFVIKAMLTLPSDNIKVSTAMLTHKTSGDGGATMTWNGARQIINPPYWNNSTGYIDMCFGDSVDSGSGTGFTVEGNTLTVYFVGFGDIDVENEDYIGVEVYSPTEGYYSGKKTLSANTLMPGKMYRLSAELVED